MKFTKEGASVMSTVARHTAWLDSNKVAQSVAGSTFDIRQILVPGTTLYLHIDPSLLDAWKGLLRCWVATIIRVVGAEGSEARNEILCLFDEASLLSGLTAVEQTLTLGRSSGIRLLLAYQSDSQVLSAFRDKPSLIYDNCATQVYLGAASIETAERLGKMCGSSTLAVESFGDNESYSQGEGGGGKQRSWGRSANTAPQGRPLLFPDEILRLSDDYLLAFQSGFPTPILARRIRWYADWAFNPAVPRPRNRWRPRRFEWALLALGVIAFCGLVVRAKVNGYGYWAPDSPAYRYEQRPVPPKLNRAAPTKRTAPGR